MSSVVYLASLVEMIEFQRALIVVIAAIDVLVVPSYNIKLPPAVILTLCISVF